MERFQAFTYLDGILLQWVVKNGATATDVNDAYGSKVGVAAAARAERMLAADHM
uniref:Uncharacterized protein n=1 Tax=Oryza brachyantha TaxID=4533 RepID=J3N3P8_ORYBR